MPKCTLLSVLFICQNKVEKYCFPRFIIFRYVENQAQTSAINSVCEFRFSSQNIFLLINENAPETVSYFFPATRCKLNQIYPSAF